MKEHAKKRNVEQLAEQKSLISSRMQLDHEAEKQFGAHIQQAAARIEALEKEIEDMRSEIVDIEQETGWVRTVITRLGSGCPNARTI